MLVVNPAEVSGNILQEAVHHPHGSGGKAKHTHYSFSLSLMVTNKNAHFFQDASPCSLTIFFPSVSSSLSCQELIESTQRSVKQKLQSFVKE